MDIITLILAILTSIGFIAAIVLRCMKKSSSYAFILELVSLILLNVVLLLPIVNGISGVSGFGNLFIFIASVAMTILRLVRH